MAYFVLIVCNYYKNRFNHTLYVNNFRKEIKMNINEFKNMWTIDKEKYVLIKIENDYGIYNKVDKTGVIIEDDEMEKQVIDKMIKNGNLIVENLVNI